MMRCYGGALLFVTTLQIGRLALISLIGFGFLKLNVGGRLVPYFGSFQGVGELEYESMHGWR